MLKFIIFACVAVFSILPAQASVDVGLGFTDYIKTAANSSLGMSKRWSALVKAADLAQQGQIAEIQSFAKASEWYMRNASLVALQKADLKSALNTAKVLVQDKALVVRSAAVDVLAIKLDNENKNVLKNELNKAYNFNRKSSLWIREQIVEKLAEVAQIEDRSFFVKNLNDTDKKVALISAQALEKITGRPVNSTEQTQYLKKWKALAESNRWL